MFDSIAQMVGLAAARSQPLCELVIEAEVEHSGKDRGHVLARMRRRLEIMQRAAEQGIGEPVMSISGISGGNAFRFWSWLEDGNDPLTGPILSRAVARAMAVNEVNAGMGCIVATPTAGSAGILPAVLLTLQEAEFVALMAQGPALAEAVRASADKRGLEVALPAPSGPQAARHLIARLRAGLRPAE